MAENETKRRLSDYSCQHVVYDPEDWEDLPPQNDLNDRHLVNDPHSLIDEDSPFKPSPESPARFESPDGVCVGPPSPEDGSFDMLHDGVPVKRRIIPSSRNEEFDAYGWPKHGNNLIVPDYNDLYEGEEPFERESLNQNKQRVLDNLYAKVVKEKPNELEQLQGEKMLTYESNHYSNCISCTKRWDVVDIIISKIKSTTDMISVHEVEPIEYLLKKCKECAKNYYFCQQADVAQGLGPKIKVI